MQMVPLAYSFLEPVEDLLSARQNYFTKRQISALEKNDFTKWQISVLKKNDFTKRQISVLKKNAKSLF